MKISTEWRPRALLLAIIIILGFAIYYPSLSGKFIWDDNVLIVDNFKIKNIFDIGSVFTKENISTNTGKTFHIYRPLQIATYAIDYAIWKLQPVGYHITSIIWHILTAIVLYYFILALGATSMIAFVASIFFISHPVHVEAVSYISGRADPLSVFFLLLTFILYLKFNPGISIIMYPMIMVSFFMALFSRENAIILPFLILCHSFVYRRKMNYRIIAIMTASVFLYSLLRFVVFKGFLPTFTFSSGSTFFQRIPGFFAALSGYISLIFMPFDLHMEYGNMLFNITSPVVITGIAVFLVIAIAAVIFRKFLPLVSFGLLWFIICLLPVSNIFPTGAYMAEHWLYLPSIGLFLAIAAIFAKMMEKKILRFIAIALAGFFIIFYSYLTYRQNFYWIDPVDFYSRTLKYAPDSVRANNDLAIAYQKMGMNDKAILIYDSMLRQNPDNPDIMVNLSAVEIVLNNIDRAIDLCARAIAIEPNNATAHNNLAVAYLVKGDYEKAVKHCDLAAFYGYKVKPELYKLLEPHRK